MTDIVVTDATPVQLTQAAGSTRLRIVDLSGQAAPFWQPNSFVASSGMMRPTDQNQTGFLFRNTGAAGQTGELEPAWPKISGGTVTDGSLSWTAQVPPTGADTVASATWTQVNPPDGTLTIANQSTSPLTASAMIGGGTAGNLYTVKVAVTMASGEIYPVTLLITCQ